MGTGYRRIHLALRNLGQTVNHKKVLRMMKKLGLKGTSFIRKSRKYSSYNGNVGTLAKNRIRRRFMTDWCHQKLATDITEFKCTGDQKLYLSPIMDLYNGEIVSYGIGMRPTLNLVVDPLERTLQTVKNAKYRTTIHSDQGWHYQHPKWLKMLQKHRIFQSMSRKGNCIDNAPMESYFGILKQEMYHGQEKCSFEELKKKLEDYIDYNNNKRIKEKLAGMSPVQYRLHTSQLAI